VKPDRGDLGGNRIDCNDLSNEQQLPPSFKPTLETAFRHPSNEAVNLSLAN